MPWHARWDEVVTISSAGEALVAIVADLAFWSRGGASGRLSQIKGRRRRRGQKRGGQRTWLCSAELNLWDVNSDAAPRRAGRGALDTALARAEANIFVSFSCRRSCDQPKSCEDGLLSFWPFLVLQKVRPHKKQVPKKAKVQPV